MPDDIGKRPGYVDRPLTKTAHDLLDHSGLVPTPGGGSALPAGAMAMWAGAAAPSGYLLCDGASLLRSAYPALFAVIGTAYGAVDGTHFNVPNMKSRFPLGLDAAASVGATLGEQGGSHTHAHGAGSLTAPAHTHAAGTLTVSSHNHGTSAITVNSHVHAVAGGISTSAMANHDHGLAAHVHGLAGTSWAKFALGSSIAQFLQVAATNWTSTIRFAAGTQAADSVVKSNGIDLGGATGPAPGNTTGITTLALTGSTDIANTNGLSGFTDPASPGVNGSTANDGSAAVTGTTATAQGTPPYTTVNFIIKT